MIFHRLHKRKSLINIIIVLSLIILTVTLTLVLRFSETSRGNNEAAPVAIENVYADTAQKLIRIHCVVPETAKTDTVNTTPRIQVTIKKEGMVFPDVYIKKIDTLSDNTMIISVQTPLKDALYGVKKREITVQLKTLEGKAVATKKVVLGTTTRTLDLRAYAAFKPLCGLINGSLLFLGISGFFILLIPLIKKYNFKRHIIKKYKEITAEDKAYLDPFTFEVIDEKDDVVWMENKLILLRSWKRLNALKPEGHMGKFDTFFKEKEKSTLFKPVTQTDRKINRIWFGMLGAYIGWLFYTGVMQWNIAPYRLLMSAIFDIPAAQFSVAAYADSFLAITLGLGMGTASVLWHKLYDGNTPLPKTLFRVMSGTSVLLVLLTLQFLITISFLNNFFIASLLTWLCIGSGLCMIARNTVDLKNILIIGSLAGISGFIIFQTGHLAVFPAILNTDLLFLISLMAMAGVLGQLTSVNTLTLQNPFRRKRAVRKTPYEVEKDNKTPLKKVI